MRSSRSNARSKIQRGPTERRLIPHPTRGTREENYIAALIQKLFLLKMIHTQPWSLTTEIDMIARPYHSSSSNSNCQNIVSSHSLMMESCRGLHACCVCRRMAATERKGIAKPHNNGLRIWFDLCGRQANSNRYWVHRCSECGVFRLFS